GCTGRWPSAAASVRRVAAHSCGALVIHQAAYAARLVPPLVCSGGVGTAGSGGWFGGHAVGSRGNGHCECLGPLDCGTMVPASGEVVGCGGPGCFLRTAQWTRASLARMRSLCLIVFLSAICFDRFVCSSF